MAELTEVQRKAIAKVADWLAGTADNLRSLSADGEDFTIDCDEAIEEADMMQTLAAELRNKFGLEAPHG